MPLLQKMFHFQGRTANLTGSANVDDFDHLTKNKLKKTTMVKNRTTAVHFRCSKVEECEVKNVYWSNYWSGNRPVCRTSAWLEAGCFLSV